MNPLRACFPVCERIAYLNAGSDGPLPEVAVAAALEELARVRDGGRLIAHFKHRGELNTRMRAAFASVIGARADDVAVTTSTGEGLCRVLLGLDLGPGDEVLTAHTEHMSLVVPLRALRERGVAVRAVDLADIADAVSAKTTLVACSHVDWITGALAPAELAQLDVPVLLDGAQAAGAIATDVAALGCAAYAGPGQKWLCGADGTGFLWLEPGFAERVRPVMPNGWNLTDPGSPWGSPLRETAAVHDTWSLPAEAVVVTLAAIGVLAEHGWDDVLARGPALAARLVEILTERGRAVAPRGDSTLVAFEDPEPEPTMLRLGEAGVSVRNVPGTPYLRASTGAWNDESDLERLVEAL